VDEDAAAEVVCTEEWGNTLKKEVRQTSGPLKITRDDRGIVISKVFFHSHVRCHITHDNPICNVIISIIIYIIISIYYNISTMQ